MRCFFWHVAGIISQLSDKTARILSSRSGPRPEPDDGTQGIDRYYMGLGVPRRLGEGAKK